MTASPLSPVSPGSSGGPGTPYRRARRDLREPVAGGVAGGLARHLALPVLWVRVGFVVATLLGGLGVAFYAGLWLTMPAAPPHADQRDADRPAGLESATRGGRRPGGSRLSRLTDAGPALVLTVVGVAFLLTLSAVLGRGAVLWPLAIGLAGLALLWRQADEAQRERWLDATGRVDPVRVVLGDRGWASWARLASGVGLIVLALGLYALRGGSLSLARDVTAAALLGVAGIGLVVGPWMFRLATELSAERTERVRTQERADVAAHLHDSVLQTLALIQKHADDGAAVARLARSQERDLRRWLYAGEDAAPGATTTVAGAIRDVAAELEDAHGVTVDVVTVGDAPLAPGADAGQGAALGPIVAATRESVTNAAKHAGVARVDVYAEIGEQGVEVFVRDRGRGFDPELLAAEPGDRHGVRDSIRGRMARHGGRADIRSAPGEGTEVRLLLPRVRPTADPADPADPTPEAPS